MPSTPAPSRTTRQRQAWSPFALRAQDGLTSRRSAVAGPSQRRGDPGATMRGLHSGTISRHDGVSMRVGVRPDLPLELWSQRQRSHGWARNVYLEDLTWTEVRDALKAGTTTIIVPVGGTEQNGPHMALGKHNVRVKALAGEVAGKLGDTLVAPVLAYVPEGTISPPAGHMRYPGTISISDATFKSLLDAAGRSFRQAGFTRIVLIGDSGNYQNLLKDVAVQLNRDWHGTSTRAHFIADYYRATQTAYVQALKSQGFSDKEIGSHAGVADTSLADGDRSGVGAGRPALRRRAAAQPVWSATRAARRRRWADSAPPDRRPNQCGHPQGPPRFPLSVPIMKHKRSLPRSSSPLSCRLWPSAAPAWWCAAQTASPATRS